MLMYHLHCLTAQLTICIATSWVTWKGWTSMENTMLSCWVKRENQLAEAACQKKCSSLCHKGLASFSGSVLQSGWGHQIPSLTPNVALFSFSGMRAGNEANKDGEHLQDLVHLQWSGDRGMMPNLWGAQPWWHTQDTNTTDELWKR